MHGKYSRCTGKQFISEANTFLWPSQGHLKAKTRSEITAAEDHALRTKYHATKILKTEIANGDYVNKMTGQ
jgi:hypothetical protein